MCRRRRLCDSHALKANAVALMQVYYYAEPKKMREGKVYDNK
jgi:hypothetical protein